MLTIVSNISKNIAPFIRYTFSYKNSLINTTPSQYADQDAERNKQITDLVKSINQLTNVYKQLNELVIDQGSLIDRIDFNIQETCGHVERGVEHLKGADDKASSPAAQKCMVCLIIGILIMACVIGFKLAK